jgi:hypothetical protein
MAIAKNWGEIPVPLSQSEQTGLWMAPTFCGWGCVVARTTGRNLLMKLGDNLKSVVSVPLKFAIWGCMAILNRVCLQVLSVFVLCVTITQQAQVGERALRNMKLNCVQGQLA